MRGALKPFQLLQSLGVPNYCQVQALLSVLNLCTTHPHNLNNNNIHSEMLMGDNTSTWWSMSDQHKHGNNIEMNRERWEISGPLDYRTMAMSIDTRTDRLRMQKTSWKSLGLPNCRTMVMATDMQTYQLKMQKKSQESSCSLNVLLIVVSMNLSPSFLQHNTNMVMAMTKQMDKP
jgi:hypothetical protein